MTLAGCAQPGLDPATDRPRLIAAGDEYVAIGDSYTAAPLNSPRANPCLRSTTNYPHQVAAELGLQLTDVSCSAASTEHFAEPQILGSVRIPPQAEALSSGTDLVTIGLGGNDFNAIGVVVIQCISVRQQDPTGAPCKDADAARGTRAIAKEIARTERRLVNVIRQVSRRAPEARIILVGYPELFPATGPCAQLPLAWGDYAFAHRINKLIVRAQKRAAARADVEFLDIYDATRGHNMCAPDPWIAGAKPARSDATAFHPYPEEQVLVADRLLNLLR